VQTDSFNNDLLHHDSKLPNRGRRNRKKKKEKVGFLEQDVDLASSILFPDGYEFIMLAIYFVTIPYVAGLIFIFFYIGKGETDLFLSLSEKNSFLITWAIGYEVVASIIILWIIKLGISSVMQSGGGPSDKKFRIP
jgi:hypothetical protein